MRGNKRREEKPSHIVSAWSKEDGFCLGQKVVDEKSNEITAIPELLNKIQVKGQVETREYYQTEDVRWLSRKKEWKGLKSVGYERKTLEKDGKRSTEERYFISSLKKDAELFSRAVREHWSVESMHWHLDVTFREDANTTLDKQAALNQNIIRKWSLSILKLLELSRHKLSLRKKRFVISLKPIECLEEVLNF